MIQLNFEFNENYFAYNESGPTEECSENNPIPFWERGIFLGWMLKEQHTLFIGQCKMHFVRFVGIKLSTEHWVVHSSYARPSMKLLFDLIAFHWSHSRLNNCYIHIWTLLKGHASFYVQCSLVHKRDVWWIMNPEKENRNCVTETLKISSKKPFFIYI